MQLQGSLALLTVVFVGTVATRDSVDFANYTICEKYHQFDRRGRILSPDFSSDELRNINCSLSIAADTDEFITIVFKEFTIDQANGMEESHATVCGGVADPNKTPNCCPGAMLKITEIASPRSVEKNNLPKQASYCGRGPKPPHPFLSESNRVDIQFISLTNLLPKSDRQNITRRFVLEYRVSKANEHCFPDEMHCATNRKCILSSWRCNGHKECVDGSDEKDCSTGSRIGGFSLPIDALSYPQTPPVPSFPFSNKFQCPGPDYLVCGDDEQCFAKSGRCDGIAHCVNRFDEIGCSDPKSSSIRSYSLCRHSLRFANASNKCSPQSTHCYNRELHRCDGILHCPNGEDELNCESHCAEKIMCASKEGCYTLTQRCDGIPDCADQSDEMGCVASNCGSKLGTYLCIGESKCILENSRCDRVIDCMDAEDEMYCIKNSVITAAIMGSLVCGILVVIAISCTCRLYAIRLLHYQRQQNCSVISNAASSDERYRRHSSISDSDLLRFDALQDLYCYYGFRDPPPPYSVAVAGDPPAIPPPPQSRSDSRRRRARHYHRMLNRRNSTPGTAGADSPNTMMDASGQPLAPGREECPERQNSNVERQRERNVDDPRSEPTAEAGGSGSASSATISTESQSAGQPVNAHKAVADQAGSSRRSPSLRKVETREHSRQKAADNAGPASGRAGQFSSTDTYTSISSDQISENENSLASSSRDAGEHLNKAECVSLSENNDIGAGSTDIEFSVLPSSNPGQHICIAVGAEGNSQFSSSDSQPLIED